MITKVETIAVFGADGQLGMDLGIALSTYNVAPLLYPDMDVRDRRRVDTALETAHPDWVINSAALTSVDWCEDHDLDAFCVNALGAKYIAEKCRAIGARFIQISTDYVFDGKKNSPYVEDDSEHPLNVYGSTKLAGERYARVADAGCYIVRTSGLYGIHPCWGKGRNFVDTMLALAGERDSLKVVDDEILTPTFTEDLAAQIRTLIEASPPGGIYHATNSGECSWFDFARAIFERSGSEIRLEKTTAAEWNAPARRPAYSVLENNRLKSAGLDTMPHWEQALERYLTKKLGS
jgi:dTDP-4-dehydrorhamnose reductase